MLEEATQSQRAADEVANMPDRWTPLIAPEFAKESLQQDVPRQLKIPSYAWAASASLRWYNAWSAFLKKAEQPPSHYVLVIGDFTQAAVFVCTHSFQRIGQLVRCRLLHFLPGKGVKEIHTYDICIYDQCVDPKQCYSTLLRAP